MSASQKNLKSQLPESMEPMILMSASAADLNPAELPEGTVGNDLLISLTPDELLDGDAGHDILIGIGGSNVLRGGEGHDTLISVRGDNVLDGGAGIDKAVYWNGNRADYQVTDLGFGIIEIAGDKHSDFITNIEIVEFRDGSYTIDELLNGAPKAPATGTLESEDAAEQTIDSLKTPTAGNDVLVANTPGEAIDGLGGNDLIVGLGNGNAISGGDGDDALVSAGGSNLIDGGAGTDTVIYTTGVQADYTIAAAEGGATSVTSTQGTDILLNVEKISFQDGTLTLSPAVVVDPVEEEVVEEEVAEEEVAEEEVAEEEVAEEEVAEEEVVEEEVVEEEVVEEEVVEEEVVEEEVAEEEVAEEEEVEVIDLDEEEVAEEEVAEEEVVEEEVVEEEEVEVIDLDEEEVAEEEVVEEEVVEEEVVEEEVVEEEVVEEEVAEEEVAEEEVVEEEEVEVIDLDEEEVAEEEVDEEEVVDPTDEHKDYTIAVAGDLYSTVGDGSEAHYELTTGPSYGSLNFYADGSFDYHGAPGISGDVSFSYTRTDEYGNTVTYDVVIHIAAETPTDEATGDDAMACDEQETEENADDVELEDDEDAEEDHADDVELEDDEDAEEDADDDDDNYGGDQYCGHQPVVTTCHSPWTWSYCSPSYKAPVYTSYCYTPKYSVNHCYSIQTNVCGFFGGLKKWFGGWC